MKKIVSILLIFCLVFSFSVALADNYNNVNSAYRYGWTGIVICTNISVRESPSTSAKRYGQLHNGDVVKILDQDDAWYTIDLSTCGFKDIFEGYGYIKKSLVKITPYWIVTTKYTPVYADPWGSGMSNGEMATGTPMLVISENNYFLCVQTRGTSAGSSFIRRSDIGYYTPDCEPGYAVVVDGPIDVWQYYGESYVIGSLKTFDIVQVVEWGYEYSHIYYKTKNDTYSDAMVLTLNLQPVIN